MIGAHYAHRLGDEWRAALDSIAKRRGFPTSNEVAKLAACVSKLSQAYNDPSVAKATAGEIDLGAARLLFSFPRDVPKSASAIRELIATGALTMPKGRPLRLLDLGAGLGASTWGIVAALEAAKMQGGIEASLIEPDEAALDIGRSIHAGRPPGGSIAVDARFLRYGIAHIPRFPHKFDLIVAGQVLSELDRERAAEERETLHTELIQKLLDYHLDEHGSLVIVEPALRERARHLHALRDALLRSPSPPTVFAPCLHSAPCPALVRENSWCHEDMNVNLPDWLIPVARGAGLRYEGLTFAYLVLRKDGISLVGAMPNGGTRLRVISGAMVTKGKREAFVCSDSGAELRAMRLDREASEANSVWDTIERGDCLGVTPALASEKPRIGRESNVARFAPSGEAGGS